MNVFNYYNKGKTGDDEILFINNKDGYYLKFGLKNKNGLISITYKNNE